MSFQPPVFLVPKIVSRKPVLEKEQEARDKSLPSWSFCSDAEETDGKLGRRPTLSSQVKISAVNKGDVIGREKEKCLLVRWAEKASLRRERLSWGRNFHGKEQQEQRPRAWHAGRAAEAKSA